jgi:hypothetical protein
MPPSEHAKAFHRNLAAELIQAESGRFLLLPSRIRSLHEPGTVVSANNPLLTRRNSINSSLQAEHRTVDALREEVQRFGEAYELLVHAETARVQQAAAAVEREQAVDRLVLDEGVREAGCQKEAASSAPAAHASVAPVPVMDMHFCIDRSEAGEFILRDFLDYWALDNRKTTPNGPNTFVPNRLVSGSNPL